MLPTLELGDAWGCLGEIISIIVLIIGSIVPLKHGQSFDWIVFYKILVMKSILSGLLTLFLVVALQTSAFAGWKHSFATCWDQNGDSYTVQECDEWGGFCAEERCGCGADDDDM